MDLKDLSPELQSKARQCKTPEEILSLAQEEGYELSEEDLQAISGGIEWNCTDDGCSFFTTPCNKDIFQS